MIPEDIVECILDEISDGDHPTFLACSTVARAFMSPSQARLFRRITISSLRGHCQKLESLLTHSPHIAFHIRTLFIESEWVLANGPLPQRPKCTFDDDALPSLLDRLPALDALHLCPQYHKTVLDWNDFSPRLKASLLRQIRFNLKKIEFCCTQIPIDVFALSRGFEELRLPGSNIVANCAMPTNAKIPLKSLCVPASPSGKELYDAISSIFDLGHLNEISIIGYEAPIFDVVIPLVNYNSSTLHRLRWTVPEFPYPMFDEFDDPSDNGLMVPSSLVSLELGFQGSGHNICLNPAFWASQSFHKLVSRGGSVLLEDVTIGFIIGYIGPMGMEYLLDSDLWGELDKSLSNEIIFPNLKRVTIFVRGGFIEEDLSMYFLERLPERLPGITKRGILDGSTRSHFTDEEDNHDYLTWRGCTSNVL